jgi:hypothetical protein
VSGTTWNQLLYPLQNGGLRRMNIFSLRRQNTLAITQPHTTPGTRLPIRIHTHKRESWKETALLNQVETTLRIPRCVTYKDTRSHTQQERIPYTHTHTHTHTEEIHWRRVYITILLYIILSYTFKGYQDPSVVQVRGERRLYTPCSSVS